MKKQRSSKGETLVETIVSFAVVMLTLTMVTAIVKLSLRLNIRAAEKSEAIETASTVIETGGMAGPLTGTTSLKLTLPDGRNVLAPIDVYRGDVLSYFTAAEVTP